MPTYKLTYFDMVARAEAIRLALLIAKQPFEDVRTDRDSWKDMKPSTPQGLLPTLEVDGQVIPQSHAIERFVARKHDLYGQNMQEWTAVDVVIDTVEDGFVIVNAFYYAGDKASQKKQLEEKLPGFLKVLEKCMDTYGNDSWMVGSKVTIADLVVFAWLDYLQLLVYPDMSVESLLASFPKLQKNRQNVRNIPEVESHLRNRKKTYC